MGLWPRVVALKLSITSRDSVHCCEPPRKAHGTSALFRWNTCTAKLLYLMLVAGMPVTVKNCSCCVAALQQSGLLSLLVRCDQNSMQNA